jgi:hypothetical protein
MPIYDYFTPLTFLLITVSHPAMYHDMTLSQSHICCVAQVHTHHHQFFRSYIDPSSGFCVLATRLFWTALHTQRALFCCFLDLFAF